MNNLNLFTPGDEPGVFLYEQAVHSHQLSILIIPLRRWAQAFNLALPHLFPNSFQILILFPQAILPHMYKTELIKAMLKKTEEQNVPLTAKQIDAALSALVETVTDALKKGEKFVLPGFGMFGGKLRPARQGYNPMTGEQIALPERKLPAFKAGKTLKDAVATE